ncbi:unnamed protein product, partial [Rotaria magnacalcarata]
MFYLKLDYTVSAKIETHRNFITHNDFQRTKQIMDVTIPILPIPIPFGIGGTGIGGYWYWWVL